MIDGKLMEAEEEDVFLGPAGRLVEAVLQMGGCCTEDEKLEDDPIEFEAIPIEFNETNTEFANLYLPWVRTAFVFLQRDRAGAEELVRGFLQGANGDRLLCDFDEQWDGVAGKFDALRHFMQTARARLLVARAHVDAAMDEKRQGSKAS